MRLSNILVAALPALALAQDTASETMHTLTSTTIMTKTLTLVRLQTVTSTQINSTTSALDIGTTSYLTASSALPTKNAAYSPPTVVNGATRGLDAPRVALAGMAGVLIMAMM